MRITAQLKMGNLSLGLPPPVRERWKSEQEQGLQEEEEERMKARLLQRNRDGGGDEGAG